MLKLTSQRDLILNLTPFCMIKGQTFMWNFKFYSIPLFPEKISLGPPLGLRSLPPGQLPRKGGPTGLKSDSGSVGIPGTQNTVDRRAPVSMGVMSLDPADLLPDLINHVYCGVGS